MNNEKDKYSDETIQKARQTVESYLRNNYKDIETVEFNNDFSSPMGGMMVRGTVNDEAGFTVDIDPETFEVMGLGEKTGFPERKEECKDQECDY